MARGNGKQAQQAVQSGRLSAFIKPSDAGQSERSTPVYVDWGEVDGNLISGAVVAANRHGGSLLFGHTRDKASYSVMVFYGGDKTPYYFPCTGDGVQALTNFLYGLCDLINDMPPSDGSRPVEPLF